MLNQAPAPTFHEELSAIRKAKRLPRKTLAARAEIDVSYLAALERGARRPPSPEKLERILDSLAATCSERQRLEQAAFFTKLKHQISEGGSSHIRDATDVVESLQQLSGDEFRVVKAVIDAIVANHIPMEALM